MQAEHRPQQDRLAAPGAADDAEDLARIDVQIDAIVHNLRTETVDDAADGDDRRGRTHFGGSR